MKADAADHSERNRLDRIADISLFFGLSFPNPHRFNPFHPLKSG
jgi:hypothetical protein